MNQLDTHNLAFWENLAFLSQCNVSLNLPATSCESTIDLASAQLIEDSLSIPDGGLSLDAHSFAEVYAGVRKPALHFISKNRRLALTLTPQRPKIIRQFHFFREAFTIAEMPANFEVARSAAPELCPCCIDAAQFRVQQIAQNPVTAILAHAAGVKQSLIFSTSTNEGGLTMDHTPVNLHHHGEYLVSEGHHDRISISICHLHAMRLKEEIVDGRSHQCLTFLNSHGHITGSLSAPTEEVDGAWNKILVRRSHCYEVKNQGATS